jgi:hypothetical protein
MRRFSFPVKYSSKAAYWPVKPIELLNFSASLTTSKPLISTFPLSGKSSVPRIWTVVVFPAPFGPSNARTVSLLTTKSMPSSTVRSLNDFLSPFTTIAFSSETFLPANSL